MRPTRPGLEAQINELARKYGVEVQHSLPPVPYVEAPARKVRQVEQCLQSHAGEIHGFFNNQLEKRRHPSNQTYF